jgi:AcrR family transcriptional regulator
MSSETAPTSSTARPMRADALRNRDRILSAAHAEFVESGGGAQMDAIAARAGVGVGTVYRHFPTKDALVAQLIRSKFEGFVANATTALEIDDPWDAFATFMRMNAQACATDVGTQHVFLLSDSSVTESLAGETGLYPMAQELIDRARAAGAVRPDFEAADIGMVMCGIASAIHQGNPRWDWERHLGFLLDGLRARPS